MTGGAASDGLENQHGVGEHTCIKTLLLNNFIKMVISWKFLLVE
jgi:hypothetical protein